MGPTFHAVLSSNSMCWLARPSSSWTLSTSPVPANAQPVRVTWQNWEIFSFSVLATCGAAGAQLPKPWAVSCVHAGDMEAKCMLTRLAFGLLSHHMG